MICMQRSAHSCEICVELLAGISVLEYAFCTRHNSPLSRKDYLCPSLSVNLFIYLPIYLLANLSIYIYVYTSYVDIYIICICISIFTCIRYIYMEMCIYM